MLAWSLVRGTVLIDRAGGISEGWAWLGGGMAACLLVAAGLGAAAGGEWMVLGGATGLAGFAGCRVAARLRALHRALDALGHGVLVLDGRGRLMACNARFPAMLDLPGRAVRRGRAFERRLIERGAGEAPERLFPLPADIEERFQPDGSVLEVRRHKLAGGWEVQSYTDVTVRWEAEERIFFLAHHDALTGLANKVALQERLAQAMAATGRGAGPLAVMCLDLDNFKHVNDSLGHGAGNELLKHVADRLRQVTRSSDILARTGGDEFVLVQTGLKAQGDAMRGAERVQAALRLPFTLRGRDVLTGASIGVAPFDGEAAGVETGAETGAQTGAQTGAGPGIGVEVEVEAGVGHAPVTADDVLKDAGCALDRAKKDGRGGIRFFERGMDEDARARAELEQALRTAIASGGLTLHFQPLFAGDATTIVAYEALLRWEHETLGAISPARFIPVAEESGLILPLGRWALEQACLEASRWAVPCVVAVNLSPVQMRRGGIPELVAEVLGRTGLDPRWLELEITEGVLIDDADAALATLTALKEVGVALALDDFGTGYSSLGYLSRFPFDKIKIDKSFTRDLGRAEGARVVAETIIAMGKSLKLRVTAEGVETDQQLRFLQARGCDEFQGFLLGRPRPAVTIAGREPRAAEVVGIAAE